MAKPLLVLPRQLWTDLEQRHHSRVDQLTAGRLERARRGIAHPVYDFLFTYYRGSVGQLRRWHPGPSILLADAHYTERSEWNHYVRDSAQGHTGLRVNIDTLNTGNGATLASRRALIAAVLPRPPVVSCFGLHEWAMLYRTAANDTRHQQVPLRISAAEIDEVVERSELRCTHFDAFRYFTDAASGRNAIALRRDAQVENDQPGCVHAGMDLYRWAGELGPAAPSELVVDCFEAAVQAREIDMRSSPYDLREWGFEPIPVETASGKLQFVQFQKQWALRTNTLRARLLPLYDEVLHHETY